MQEVKIGNTLTTGKWDDRDTKAKLATCEKPIIEILRRNHEKHAGGQHKANIWVNRRRGEQEERLQTTF